MALVLTAEEQIAARRIKKLRTMLLAFRFLYYCREQSIVEDPVYDAREFELRTLVEAYPDAAASTVYHAICPSQTVGSSSVVNYPDEIMDLAERLLYTYDELQGGACPAARTTEALIADLEGVVAQLSKADAPAQPGIFG